MYCYDVSSPLWYIYSTDVPSLLYYSHIPALLISIFFGVFILKNSNNPAAKNLFLVTLFTDLLIISNILVWVNNRADIISFFWILTIVFYYILPFISFRFFYSFVKGKNPNIVIDALMSISIIIFTMILAFGVTFNWFNSSWCGLIEKGKTNTIIQIASFVVVIIGIFYIYARSVFTQNGVNKKTNTIVFIGIIMFLFNLFFVFQLVDYLSSYSSFNIELYSLLGLPVFVAMLSYVIVKYKTFNIKLLGVQALVWALVIIIGSEFFFIQNNINRVLTAITLVLAAVSGTLIVRSVKREVSLRESLEVANKGQENLIHIMNHQIKGFLGMARNIFAELLQSNDYGIMPEACKPFLNKGLETTTAGVNYVQDILRGASATKGTLVYNMKPTDVKNIVSQLLVEQKIVADQNSLSFDSEVKEGDYNTIADEVQLKEAFKNLITNGIKYNDYNYPQRGIKVDLRNENGKIIFSVKDTGVGISEEDKPKLFTPGGMGKDSIKLNVESSGFGLAFVKGVVDAHKGIVGYRSNAPEKGTTFYIELPVRK